MSIKPYMLTDQGFVNQDELRYPFEERGLQFGDGVYEVIRIYSGQYYLIKEHVERLFRSAEAIKIKMPFSKEETYEKLNELLEKNSVDGDAKVYLQLTRGSAPRDHAFPKDVPANLYAYVQDLPRKMEALQEGVSTITQPDVRWDYCYIKSLNLLPNVLAKQEATEKGAFEAILHRNKKVTEGSSSNVYLVKDGIVYTHPATENILHGCVRMRVEALSRQLGFPFIQAAFSLEDIAEADELFISSSTAEIMPVVKVDDVTVGSGNPGPVTQRLQQAYEKDANIPQSKSIFPEAAQERPVSG
ncbi:MULTISPECIES: D-amino-acid transaminase [Pontibacillus]|uniref:D-alanine aminotransferase n=1 Tax=Pontibacillus chungwhensis TaxID=265426 RepID=A0ABY8UYT5_9BACI|nr:MULTISPECIES: D-amino-acid transaminase [Pontibacillus]MCD5324880.1 D-amino-acid transaminase [Pontibacillus sp. HN14]WIF98841.1 D-amino-acid transaminase [Pontibacillus chungwhensis]